MILDTLVAAKKKRLAVLERAKIIETAEKLPVINLKDNGFKNVLNNEDISIIGEIKKASPSKGIIREDFDYIKIAREYMASGVNAISVLTEEDYFKGSPEYLKKISEVSSIPLLRKDFIIDPVQIYEARVLGASAVLLIAAICDQKQLKEFIRTAEMIGLHCLVEVHDQEELYKVLECDAKIIGINNRNLKNFDVDLSTTETLAGQIPKDKLIVSESGINNYDDVKRVKNSGANAVLIGETFMRAASIRDKVLELKGLKEAVL